MSKRQPLPELGKTVPHEQNQELAKDRAIMSTFSNVDFQRTRFWCLAGAAASNIPRRVGPDATREELKYDKKISRKFYHQYRTLWHLFNLETTIFPPPPDWNDISDVGDPLLTRISATVIWERQTDFLMDVVLARMGKLTDLEYLARIDGMKSWYNKHAEILNWELEALHRVKGRIEAGMNPKPIEPGDSADDYSGNPKNQNRRK